MLQLVGTEVFLKSYFANLGTKEIQKKLNEIINDPSKSSQLFRSVELNYCIGYENSEQNVLGNIQLSLLDYLDSKVASLPAENREDEIRSVLTNYEKVLITPEKLEKIQKNPQLYVGVDESVERFSEIKSKYGSYLGEETKSSTTAKK